MFPGEVRGRLTTVSCTMRWLRLEVAFMAVLATTLHRWLFMSCAVR